MAVRTERSEVSTNTTEGQYSPVQLELARLVSSLLYGTRAMLVLSLPAFENKKNTQLMTVSTGTVRMSKSRPRKNQSKRSDLPCHIINVLKPTLGAKQEVFVLKELSHCILSIFCHVQ